MLSARLWTNRDDDMDEPRQDFEAVGVVSLHKPGARDETLAHRERRLKIRAIRLLRDKGWKQEDIAVAVGYSERHVRRWDAMTRSLRPLAEASGRV